MTSTGTCPPRKERRGASCRETGESDDETIFLQDFSEGYLTYDPVPPIILTMATILDTLRRAIKASAKSRYQLWQETGIDQSQLSRLMQGKGGVSIESLEKLAAALDLNITIQPKQKRRGR